MRKIWQYFWLASMALIMSACVTTITRGHLKEDEAMGNIKIGVTTREETAKVLGSPSSESTFGPKKWYYVSSIRHNRSLLAPKVVDQRVTEIAFNENNVVSGVKEYSLKDSKPIEIASNITPTEGQQLGFFEQIFSNLGRFNKKDDATSNNHGHSGSAGVPGGSGVYR
jgi:outer membrane protein assembly factor BamE (lipoprotein component of BamABCDE complex)